MTEFSVIYEIALTGISCFHVFKNRGSVLSFDLLHVQIFKQNILDQNSLTATGTEQSTGLTELVAFKAVSRAPYMLTIHKGLDECL